MPNRAEESPDPFAEREARILDAAAELVQRWGYKKTTIDDIAQRAEVGKGTIYLHWKTREELFIALLLRERLRAVNEAEQQLASDPEGTTLHTAVKYVTLAVLTNPLLRAAVQQDNAIWSDIMRMKFVLADTEQRMTTGRHGLELLREQGRVRDDDDLDDQMYMLAALSTGFMVLNHYLPEEKRLSPDIVANLLAKVVHRTFEGLAPDRGEAGESRQIFHELFDQARALSHKKVE
jgi:AcrR family transcriptional regulator